MQEHRVRENQGHSTTCSKEFLSARRLEVVFKWLLWELTHIHIHAASRTTALTFYFIHNQPSDGFEMLFHKATLWDNKYNLIFSIWSDYSLHGDYLWRGLSHSTVTGSRTCTGQETSYFSRAIFNKTSLHVLCFLMEEHVKTQKEVIWLFDLVLYSSFVTIFFNQCLRAKFIVGLSIVVHF